MIYTLTGYMTHWRESWRVRGTLVLKSKDGRHKLVIRRDDVDPSVFTAYFLSLTGSTTPLAEDRPSSGWTELWPDPPIQAGTVDAVRSKALPILTELPSNTGGTKFVAKPYQPAARPTVVWRIDAPSHHAWANVLEHSADRYEIRHYGDLVGHQDPGVGIFPPGMQRESNASYFESTFVDNIDEAMIVAADELGQIVQANSDLFVLRLKKDD